MFGGRRCRNLPAVSCWAASRALTSRTLAATCAAMVACALGFVSGYCHQGRPRAVQAMLGCQPRFDLAHLGHNCRRDSRLRARVCVRAMPRGAPRVDEAVLGDAGRVLTWRTLAAVCAALVAYPTRISTSSDLQVKQQA